MKIFSHIRLEFLLLINLHFQLQAKLFCSSKARLDLKPDAIPTQNPPVPKALSRSAQERRERAEERTHDETIMNLLKDEGKIIICNAASRGD